MLSQSLYHTYQRYRTLQTDRVYALPIAILLPHSACNCRCIMCDIWKDNKNLKQLTENDIRGLLDSFKKLGTRRVLMSGGEAMLNPNFFRFCEILRQQRIRITLLSTGLTLKNNLSTLMNAVDGIIVSLDGDEATHDRIRNIPGAYRKLQEGVRAIKSVNPGFRIMARSVIHRLNYSIWPRLIDCAKEIGLDQVSFLPADVSSHAFNREIAWNSARQQEILPDLAELDAMQNIIDTLRTQYREDFEKNFIAESPGKIQQIHTYYAAVYGLNPFPFKKCNAPWVSTVIEPDGQVRPCFFHPPLGNIRTGGSLDKILNSESAIQYRKNLDTGTNDTCRKCVCSLNLPPRMDPAVN